ncbi:hypothetical protein L6164_032533 [Bauhinia variegata]|uniref:Uncharacterized protein n=1 Tax=Bauhinia variegata TaxID=167791 RepID=A0ACB9KPT0_BAUVA|nr:hypothetical protein L6164_032533 [Bauhinia variegata]
MLNEQLYLGSVLGAVLIVIGLYMVLWGKSKETQKTTPAETSLESEVVVDINGVEMSTRVHDKGDYSIHTDRNNSSQQCC